MGALSHFIMFSRSGSDLGMCEEMGVFLLDYIWLEFTLFLCLGFFLFFFLIILGLVSCWNLGCGAFVDF